MKNYLKNYNQLLYNYFKEKKIFKENINQDVKLGNIDKARYYFIAEINQFHLMSWKHTHRKIYL